MYCGEVTIEQVGKQVTLAGWVQKRRDLGGMIFLDLRDREGIIQVVFNAEKSKEAFIIAETLRSEFVVELTGKVVKRQDGTINKDLPTGEIEIEAESISILNKAKTPPFDIQDTVEVSDDIRLKYRYLDLRRNKMKENMIMRHKVKKVFSDFLDSNGFLDIETPYLTKSTPEGARDYLVPSRVHEGKFFALPQSPQLFKQLLMGAGIDRYYQIVRCFRDEDLRGDRQPEFTQVDIETSFIDEKEIQGLMEKLLVDVVKETKNMEISRPFPRISYDEAMNRYGSDKPDTRFDLELIELGDIVTNSDFKVFTSTIENGGVVKGLNVKGVADDFSRKNIDALGEVAPSIDGAKGLAWMKMTEEEFSNRSANPLPSFSSRLIL